MSTERDDARGRLLKLQKRVYRSLQAEARELLGESPRAIREYETVFERDFSRMGRLSPVTKAELVEAMRKARVTFIADYHTFAQAQRTALRLAQAAVRPGDEWMLGLEMIPSTHQKSLDAFQRGELSEAEFLERIDYAEEWGFRWPSYAPIFEWARASGVRLLALNLPRREDGSSASLAERDEWAARVIVEKLKRPERRVIALYGELHVARSHLPAQLERVAAEAGQAQPRWMSVHQNHDRVYWRLAERGRETSDAVRLSRNSYCVVSSTPWAKLQSLVSWAEGGQDSARDLSRDSRDSEDEGATDFLSLLRLQGEMICEFLGVPSPSYESITLKTIQDGDFLDEIAASGHFSRHELKIIEHHLDRNWRIYLPRAGLAYLGSPSLNGTAELAAAHLQHQRMRALSFGLQSQDDYFRATIESAFRFFGSLVLNPRRKCDLVDDHRKRIEALAGQDSPRARLERAQRELALETLDMGGKRLCKLRYSGEGLVAAVAAARFAGRILGLRLHRAVHSGVVSPESARHLCLARAEGSHRPFEERYRELLEAVEKVSVSPSKALTL